MRLTTITKNSLRLCAHYLWHDCFLQTPCLFAQANDRYSNPFVLQLFPFIRAASFSTECQFKHFIFSSAGLGYLDTAGGSHFSPKAFGHVADEVLSDTQGTWSFYNNIKVIIINGEVERDITYLIVEISSITRHPWYEWVISEIWHRPLEFNKHFNLIGLIHVLNETQGLKLLQGMLGEDTMLFGAEPGEESNILYLFAYLRWRPKQESAIVRMKFIKSSMRFEQLMTYFTYTEQRFDKISTHSVYIDNPATKTYWYSIA